MAKIKEGLKQSLAKIREVSSDLYHQYVPVVDDETDIGSFATPILETPVLMNEFVSLLVNRIAYTQYELKYFDSPLKVLEGDEMPLGQVGQEIYVNPAKRKKI